MWFLLVFSLHEHVAVRLTYVGYVWVLVRTAELQVFALALFLAKSAGWLHKILIIGPLLWLASGGL